MNFVVENKAIQPVEDKKIVSNCCCHIKWSADT